MAPNDYQYPNPYTTDQRVAPYSAYAASRAPHVSPTNTTQPAQQNNYAGYVPQHSQNDGNYGVQRLFTPNAYHAHGNGHSGLGNLAYASSLNTSHAQSGQGSQHSPYIASRPIQTPPALDQSRQPGYPTCTNTAPSLATSSQRYAETGYQSQRSHLPGVQPPRAGSPAQAQWLQQQTSARSSSPKVSQTANVAPSQVLAQIHVDGHHEGAQSHTSETNQTMGGRDYDRSINKQYRVFSSANGLRAQTTDGGSSSTAASHPPVTVDPSHVYDPYHEYQRRARIAEQEDAKRKEQVRCNSEAKKAEEAKRAEEARRIDEARKAEEAKRAEEARRIDEARKAEEAKRTEEAKRAEKAKKAEEQRKAEERADKVRKANEAKRMSNNLQPNGTAQDAPQQEALRVPVEPAESNGDAEELKAIFEKMRKLHEKNPVLVASMWEQERKSHQDIPHSSGATQFPVLEPQQSSKQITQAPLSTNQLPGPAVTPRNFTGVNGASSKAAPAAKPLRRATAGVIAEQQSQLPAITPRPTNAGTIWPADKKATLAAAAANLLKAIPENRGKPITAEKICFMLDSNPSYIDLCERLEGLNIALDRALFARALLQACPDVNSSSAKIPAPSGDAPTIRATDSKQGAHLPSEKPKTTHRPAQVQTNVPTVLNGTMIDSTRSQNGMARPLEPSQVQADRSVTVSATTSSRQPPPAPEPRLADPYRSLYFHPAQPMNRQDSNATPQRPLTHLAPVAVMAPFITGVKGMPRPAAPSWDQSWTLYQRQKSKAEMAKKRSFGEIVDLTQTLSDEEDTVEPLPKRPELKGNDFRPAEHPADSVSEANQAPISTTAVPVAAATDDPLRSAKMVEPLDKSKARRRSRYNPLTIARDVLLATGRHPDMRALNAHLESLKSFKSVTNDSDLSSFRWDLVDPGEPTPIWPAVRIARIQENEDADDEADELDDVDGVSASSRVQQQPLAATNGDVLLSNHIVSAASFGPVKALHKRRVGRPPRHSDPGVRNRPYGFGNGGTERTPTEGQRDADQPSTPSGTSRTDAASSSRGAPQSAASRSSPANTGTGYAAFRQQLSADGTPLPKKKGRPVGWRKSTGGIPATSHQGMTDRTRPVNAPSQPSRLRNVHTPLDGVEVVISSQSPSRAPDVKGSAANRRGRPPRNVEPPNMEPTEPVYQAYKCEWEDCSAELHNLDTLRKHVHQIHGKKATSGKYLCLWGTCRQPIGSIDLETGDETTDWPRYSLADRLEWKTHVEKKHISPIAWELGDGPAAGLSDHRCSDLSETYLSDSQGRQVTPRVTLPPAARTSESGQGMLGLGAGGSTAARQSAGSGSGRIRGARTYTTPEEKAREDLKRLERKKRMIGPGVDRGGARLANDKRRAGFIDDEDFEMEVGPEDD